LMVFIRPKIIDSVATMNAVSSRKYNYMRARQLDWQQRGVSLMPSAEAAVLPQWDNSLALPPSFEETLKKHDLEAQAKDAEESEKENGQD